jgi:hypothetical protein
MSYGVIRRASKCGQEGSKQAFFAEKVSIFGYFDGFEGCFD